MKVFFMQIYRSDTEVALWSISVQITSSQPAYSNSHINNWFISNSAILSTEENLRLLIEGKNIIISNLKMYKQGLVQVSVESELDKSNQGNQNKFYFGIGFSSYPAPNGNDDSWGNLNSWDYYYFLKIKMRTIFHSLLSICFEPFNKEILFNISNSLYFFLYYHIFLKENVLISGLLSFL